MPASFQTAPKTPRAVGTIANRGCVHHLPRTPPAMRCRRACASPPPPRRPGSLTGHGGRRRGRARARLGRRASAIAATRASHSGDPTLADHVRRDGGRRLEAAIHDPLQPLPQRREDRGEDQRRDDDRGIRTIAGDRLEDALEQRDDRRIQAGDDGREGHVDEGPVDQPVDLVQPVSRHGDAHGDRNEQQPERGDQQRRGAAEARQERQHQRQRRQAHGHDEPACLLAFDGRAAAIAHDHRREPRAVIAMIPPATAA